MPRAPIPVRFLSAGLLLPIALAGCSSYQAPSFEAVSVREAERTDTHAVLIFEVRATNPNREPMPLGKATYTLRFDDTVVFEGVRSPESTVDTYASNSFELPAVVPAGLIATEGRIGYTLDGQVVYRRPGAFADVLFDAQITVPEAPLSIRGVITLD